MTPKLEPTLAGVCTFANGSAQCGSGEAVDPIHVSSICGEMLAQAAKTAKNYPGAKIRVEGNRNPSEDKSLAAERASAVKAKLVSEYGIDAQQISVSVGTAVTRTVSVFVE